MRKKGKEFSFEFLVLTAGILKFRILNEELRIKKRQELES
jgi:hypothetical protein